MALALCKITLVDSGKCPKVTAANIAYCGKLYQDYRQVDVDRGLGLNIFNIGFPDIQGETALHKAARSGNAECVNLLIATSCNVSSQNSCGQTASMIAEQAGFSAIASYIRQSELLSSGLQPLQNGLNGFQPPRFSRKRTRDMCEDTFKRIRTDDVSNIPLPPLPMRHCSMNPMTTSVVDHERLCRMESGYTKTIVESMFSEFHGC